jgi:hypothetical protein
MKLTAQGKNFEMMAIGTENGLVVSKITKSLPM